MVPVPQEKEPFEQILQELDPLEKVPQEPLDQVSQDKKLLKQVLRAK